MAAGPVSGTGPGAVLSLFRDGSARTRADVMRLTGLSRSTAAHRVDILVAAGYLTPGGETASTGGRPPESFSFNVDAGVLALADIGASGMRTAVANLAGAVFTDRTRRIDVAAGPQPVLDQVLRDFAEMLDGLSRAPTDVRGVGVSVPGPVEFATGRVVSPPIMTGWDGFDIPGFIASHFDTKIVVDNDVNAMAFGEQRACYPRHEHLLFVKAGTGIGAGIIAAGRIHRGADGAAGDIGHIQVHVDPLAEPPLCRCGNPGCVEAYAGGWALARDLRAAGLPVDRVDDVVRVIRDGNPTAVRLARRAGRILGAAIADAVSFFNPSVVVIGGQLARAEDQLLAGVRELVYQRSLPLATRRLAINRSRLDLRAGVVGLAHILIDTLYAPSTIDALLAG